MKYETRKLSELTLWDKNPRSITEVDLERLKKLISKLGLFKPFLVTPEGVILGGNMRFKACKELGIEEVPVSIVEAKTEQKRLEFALADNDRSGKYETEVLKKMVLDLPDLELDLFKIDLGLQVDLNNLINSGSTDVNLEWEGMPDFKNEDKTAFKQIIVSFANEDDLKNFAELVEQNISMKTRSIWFPEAEIGHASDKVYESEG